MVGESCEVCAKSRVQLPYASWMPVELGGLRGKSDLRAVGLCARTPKNAQRTGLTRSRMHRDG
jgi:hypothetical protein